ncbi:MAG: hypothetical protein MN733_23995 [Nitrososphaera sp.]|nr:hypothetical protein [Nitrososphaera sp.]
MDKGKEAIGQHFIDMMPPDIRRLKNLANCDLYYGPISEPDDGGPWPGFVSATTQLTDWATENLSEVWYDIQFGEVLLSEPEGYYGEEAIDDSYDYFDYRDVKRAVFGKELAHYI